MINMNDEQYQDNSRKIFNGGTAGVVAGCDIAVKKKGREEADNKPDYSFDIIDSNGGVLNKGFYDPSDKSQKAKNFFVKEFNYYARSVFKVPVEDSYESYKALMDDLMGKFKDAAKGIKVNAAVGYGTEAYPKRFLEIGGYWELKNVEDGMPTLSPATLTERPAADDEPKIGGGAPAGQQEEAIEEEW